MTSTITKNRCAHKSTDGVKQPRNFENRNSQKSESHDEHEHPFTAIPENQRRGPFTMGLLWITMVTAFPSVLVGFEWCKQGFTLTQVLSCTVLSCLLLLAYAIPASQLGAVSGLSYAALSRSVFGRWGSKVVTFNLVAIFVAWYGLAALFLAEGLEGLFQWKAPLMILSVAFAFLMAMNNFFGFKGVANFARFFAAPVLIVWVSYVFLKTVPACPASVITEVTHKSFSCALTTISTFIVGFAVWGNEADYWRFSKPKVRNCAIPLLVALMIGQVIFPCTGFIVAKISGITDYGVATSFMNDYSFGGLAIVGAIVIAASYFAANDSNLFGSVSACENLQRWSHKGWVAVLAILGAAMAAWLSVSGAAKSLESIASLNCVIVPTPTLVVLAEWFLMRKFFARDPECFGRVPELDELPKFRWAATIALVSGISVGVLTSGAIPGTESLHVGICSLQAWATAFFVYIPLRIVEYRREVQSRCMALEALVAVPCPVESGVASNR